MPRAREDQPLSPFYLLQAPEGLDSAHLHVEGHEFKILFRKTLTGTLRNNVLFDIWVSWGLAKFTHKVNHCKMLFGYSYIGTGFTVVNVHVEFKGDDNCSHSSAVIMNR